MDTRTMEQITNEYTGLCAKAGDLAFRISLLEGQLSEVNTGLAKLNAEAVELKAKESKGSSNE